jgi:hypothetical protein
MVTASLTFLWRGKTGPSVVARAEEAGMSRLPLAAAVSLRNSRRGIL